MGLNERNRPTGAIRGVLVAVVAAFVLGACASTPVNPSLPVGDAAYKIIPPPDPATPQLSYAIVPNDVLDIQVFQEPDLSNKALPVDDVGNIQLPLVGELTAAGRSPAQLAAEITSRLGRRYIVNPQVVVSVAKSASRFVTVEGQVTKPGVYEVDRGTTLLSAIAKAESPTSVARLSDTVVFRTVGVQRMAARFDINDVRAGLAPDPLILGGDVVVVGYSRGKGAWRDLLQAAPLFNLFYLLR